MQSHRDLDGDLRIIDALVRAGHEWEDRQPERAARAWIQAADLAAEHELGIEEANTLTKLVLILSSPAPSFTSIMCRRKVEYQTNFRPTLDQLIIQHGLS